MLSPELQILIDDRREMIAERAEKIAKEAFSRGARRGDEDATRTQLRNALNVAAVENSIVLVRHFLEYQTARHKFPGRLSAVLLKELMSIESDVSALPALKDDEKGKREVGAKLARLFLGDLARRAVVEIKNQENQRRGRG